MTSIERDDDGYLYDPELWTPELAHLLATEEGLTLSDEHWIVISFIREWHDDHGITPDIRHVAKHLAVKYGVDKKAGKAKIFELFPYGYVKQACKIAGMLHPRAWSTG